MTSPIRVLVVEDSLTIRRRLCDALRADPELLLVGEAEDGNRAIELCKDLRPDVVTMDMMLPVMSGLAATEYIMAHCPTPILIVSSSTNRGELFELYDALAAGAVDVLEKPTGAEPDGAWEGHLISTVKLIARIRVITHLRARLGTGARADPAPPPPSPTPLRPGGEVKVLAIGASTGGPGAIVDVLRALPTDVRLPILVVLHIGEPFAVAFADWLHSQIERPVEYARDGKPLAALAGSVAMAPPDRHLTVRGGRIRLTLEPERHSCRPSVDVLLESLARDCGRETAACLLTGMGRDGAAGLLDVRLAGGVTIAQDEASSVVYGMPKEAALLGAAERILPLNQIGPSLAALCRAYNGATRE